MSIREAAVLRAEQVRQVTDRPSKRRSADGGRAFTSAPVTRMELRALVDSTTMVAFEGMASVTERAYPMYDAFGEYVEIVSRGAFTDTLARGDLDVPLVLGHDQMRRIARTINSTLSLQETDDGLQVRAHLDSEDPDVAYVIPKIRSGLLDEMSFGFRIDTGTWSADYTEYRIGAVDLHRGDVSIVGWGANPFTSSGLRDAAPLDLRLAKLRAARLADAIAS